MSPAAVPFPTFDTPENYQARKGKRLALSLLAIAVFCGWQAAVVRRFVKLDTRPPSWDQAVHLEIALDYRNALAQGRWGDVWRLAPKPGMPPFPPLYHLALTRAYGSEQPAQAALWVNWAYLCVLAFSLFALASEFKPDSTAVAASMAFCCSPAIQSLLTTQLIDLSVIACSAAAYWALVRSDDFKKWGPSLAFGALYAAGMMHKWSFFSYMIPAYVLGLRALGDQRSMWKAVAAAGLALAGFAPWYLSHAAVLLPRLFQASADFAVPVWQGGTFLTYLFQTLDGFGPLFWLFAWIGLLVPHYYDNEDKGWLIWSSVALSYVFWTIVPNRQLRFLLPGLPGLAVAFCAAWPNPMVWAMTALQLAFAANFSVGWIPSFSIPLGSVASVTFFPSGAPRKDDWKAADVLREAIRRLDASQPSANLTLVANATYFNGPTFSWTRKALDLPRVNVRGVNKRLCEFSQFVALKEGELGPASVIAGLPEAAKEISARDGWFQRSYDKAAQWDLPDGSHAVLYQQRRFAFPPFKSKGTQFAFYETGPFSAEGFKADLGAWDAARGVYPLARVQAAEGTLRGLKLLGPSVELEDALVVPAGDIKRSEWDEVRFLKLKTLRVKKLAVDAKDLRTFLEGRIKGLAISKLELDRTIRLEGAYGRFPVVAEASVELKERPRRLVVTLLEARFGAAPPPAALLAPYRTLELPLEPTPDVPFVVELPGLTLKGGKLSIP